MKTIDLDEEKLFEEKIEKMLQRIPESTRTAEMWTVGTTAKFLKKEGGAVRRMIAEGKTFTFKNCGVHEVYRATVLAYLRRQNGF